MGANPTSHPRKRRRLFPSTPSATLDGQQGRAARFLPFSRLRPSPASRLHKEKLQHEKQHPAAVD